jgi:long-chain fatty acid transport protein
MKKLMRMMIGALVIATAGVAIVPPVFGLGFDNPDQDARATGQGEAFVAQADDASAIYYNPAGLTQLKGTEITSGLMASFPDARLKGGGPGTEMNTMATIPHLYASTDFGIAQSPWRFGIGFNVPFGNVANYPRAGPFRYEITTASLAVYDIQPTVAFQVNEHLSLGAGVNVYLADTRLNRQVSFAPFPDGKIHFGAKGDAVGASAGLLWKITPQHTIGLLYRSPFNVDFTGNGKLVTPIGNQQNPANTTIEFPQFVKGGYAFRPIPQWKLEADVEWINWDTLNTVTLHAAPTTPFNGVAIPFNWKDSWYYEFGTEYEINEHWTIRGGYIFSVNTVPKSTFSPTVPDSNRHVFSLGGGYSTKRYSVDLVYQYSLSTDRTINNGTAADGTWQSSNQAVLITSSLKF